MAYVIFERNFYHGVSQRLVAGIGNRPVDVAHRVPDEILSRMSRAASPEAAREEGVAIAREMLAALRERVQGAQISAPQGRYTSAVDVLEALGSKRPASV